MAKFKVVFIRQVVERDAFTREIEAETEDEARNLALDMAVDAAMSCPDDAAPLHDESHCGDWGILSLKEVKDGKSIEREASATSDGSADR